MKILGMSEESKILTNRNSAHIRFRSQSIRWTFLNNLWNNFSQKENPLRLQKAKNRRMLLTSKNHIVHSKLNNFDKNERILLKLSTGVYRVKKSMVWASWSPWLKYRNTLVSQVVVTNLKILKQKFIFKIQKQAWTYRRER